MPDWVSRNELAVVGVFAVVLLYAIWRAVRIGITEIVKLRVQISELSEFLGYTAEETGFTKQEWDEMKYEPTPEEFDKVCLQLKAYKREIRNRASA